MPKMKMFKKTKISFNCSFVEHGKMTSNLFLKMMQENKKNIELKYKNNVFQF